MANFILANVFNIFYSFELTETYRVNIWYDSKAWYAFGHFLLNISGYKKKIV